MAWILDPEPKQPVSPAPIVEDLLSSPQYFEAEKQTLWLRRNMLVSEAVIKETDQATMGQRSNSMWAVLRKYRLTASNFGPCLAAAKRQKLTKSLKCRLVSSYNLETVKSIAWGITHEKDALVQYQSDLGAAVCESGLLLHESGALGASPDGVVLCPPVLGNIHYQSPQAKQMLPQLLEIKCPYSAANMTVMEAAKSLKNFFLEVKDESLHLKESHDYYHQIQGQLHISGKLCCDLFVWTTVDHAIVRVVKDLDWTANISRLIDFYYNFFIPALLE